MAVAQTEVAADVRLTALSDVVPDSTAVESTAENPESGNVRLVVALPKVSLPLKGVSAIDSVVAAAIPFDLAVVVPAEQVDSS